MLSEIIELIKLGGGELTVAAIMFAWLYREREEKKELQDKLDKLNEYLRESDKANLSMLESIQHVVTSILSDTTVKDVISSEIKLVLSKIENLGQIIQTHISTRAN